MPSFSIDTSGNDSPAGSIPRNGRAVLITLNGTGTAWTPGSEVVAGSPTFALTGGAGSCVVEQNIYSATLATLKINAGPSIAQLTITDPQNSITATVNVASTFEESMLANIEGQIQAVTAGMTTVSIDGQTVALRTMGELFADRDMILRRLNQQNGRRPRVSRINLASPCFPRGVCP